MALAGEILKVYAGKKTNLPQTLTMEHVSGATRLLEKRRQMFEVQEALDAQKEEFARREDAFRRREDALRRKDVELQESLIKFNKFLQVGNTQSVGSCGWRWACNTTQDHATSIHVFTLLMSDGCGVTCTGERVQKEPSSQASTR